jgi:hypothetical protein
MNSVAKEIQEIFEDEVVPWCDKAFTHAGITMKKNLELAGVEMTRELTSSIFSERTYVTDQLEVGLRLGMRGYGRFKDMRELKYDTFLPHPEGDLITGLERFVEKTGIRNFSYVPGYYTDAKRRVAIPDSRAKNRIAWGIAMSIIKKGRQKRKSPFYNVNRGKVYSDIIEHLMTKLPAASLKKLVELYNKPVSAWGGEESDA